MQLIVDQQREIERLKARVRDRQDDEEQYDQSIHELRNLLNRIIDQAEPIADLNPKTAQPGTEDFERLQIAANNILRLVSPHLRQRQPAPEA